MIGVTGNGAVTLGPDVVCDGFVDNVVFRVQSHIHDDHMSNFSTSKGRQAIYMSKQSYELLLERKNADLCFRSNIRYLEFGQSEKVGNSEITLLSSGHMLGAAQTHVKLENDLDLGYSGDFSWPIDDVIQVRKLVVDSTCGNPSIKRNYSQEEADEKLIELISLNQSRGPIVLKAFRGTLQRALDRISGEFNLPLIATKNTYGEIQIYQRHGYNINNIHSLAEESTKKILETNRYIFALRGGEKNPATLPNCTKITLSAFIANPDNPVTEHGGNSYSIALSEHADFDGTLEYIKSTGAKEVVTDNSRGGNAIVLANEIRSRLNINVRPSCSDISREWGA